MHKLHKTSGQRFYLGLRSCFAIFYVDDLMSGGKSKEEAVTIMDQTSKILAKGNFKLKKC